MWTVDQSNAFTEARHASSLDAITAIAQTLVAARDSEYTANLSSASYQIARYNQALEKLRVLYRTRQAAGFPKVSGPPEGRAWCHRCYGQANTFARFAEINNGKCLRCHGSLLEPLTPVTYTVSVCPDCGSDSCDGCQLDRYPRA